MRIQEAAAAAAYALQQRTAPTPPTSHKAGSAKKGKGKGKARISSIRIYDAEDGDSGHSIPSPTPRFSRFGQLPHPLQDNMCAARYMRLDAVLGM
jgi:hypothetical protein